MRPVAKGLAPQISYSHYRDALDDLAGQIGLFCSYCEQPIQHATEVEHVQPKSLNPHLKNSWPNLLLACMSCNRIKSNKPVNRAQVAMPDTDNTFRGLVFLADGEIQVSAGLTGSQTRLMSQVVDLVGLNRHPNNKIQKDRPTKRDRRVLLRNEVWVMANRYLEFIMQPQVDPRIRKMIADYALAKGFFSVWMTVFRSHPNS